MTINRIKEIMDLLANKYQLGYQSGKDFNNLFRLSELAQLSFLVGNLHQFSPGRPVPRVGLGMTKHVQERLSPFRFSIVHPVSANVDGVFDKPVDLAAIESVNGDDGTEIKPVTPKALGRILKSSIWKTDEDPVYVEYDTSIRVYHPDIENASFTDVVITGIANPPESKWAYTVVSDEEVYNNVASIDPLWSDIDCMEIIGRMCKHVGISLRDGELAQYGQSVINQGE